MAKQAKEQQQLLILRIEYGEARFNLLGASPMIMHRFSQKAWRELLLPSPKANRAELEQNLKHDPLNEYRGAFYRNRDTNRPTFFHIPNMQVHGALASAALDTPGVNKTQMERLTAVTDVNIDLYGVPQMFMSMVREGQARTPNVRTRPIFPQWGCTVTVRYRKNIITERNLATLMTGAGEGVGIGDWRPQKGGPYGTFKIVGDDNKAFQALKKTQVRKAQQSAYITPGFFDEDTEELFIWFEAEVKRREMEGQLNTDHELEPEGGRHRINAAHKKIVVQREEGKSEGEDDRFMGTE
jgi:hypothetical protein